MSVARAPALVAVFTGVALQRYPQAVAAPATGADNILDEAGSPILDEAGNPVEDEAGT